MHGVIMQCIMQATVRRFAEPLTAWSVTMLCQITLELLVIARVTDIYEYIYKFITIILCKSVSGITEVLPPRLYV